jgi:sugar lactone lactonase YvrE
MITTLVNEHCELGENPLWHPEKGCLLWTDITGGRIHRFNLDSGWSEVIYHGPMVGGFTLQENGDILLFRENDIACLGPGGIVESIHDFDDDGATRFNDVIADPEGRVFAGTIGRTDKSGGLYRMDCDGRLTLLFRGTGVSNGMGFSPDLKTFYWTCSTRRCIFAYDYDRTSGALHDERIFYRATPDEGIPDGMTVDNRGHVWSARWDGFAVVHHAPDGSVVDRFTFPVAKVSSLCFGGPERDAFFVTTAGGMHGGSSEDGSVYRLSLGVQGPAEFRSRIASRGT